MYDRILQALTAEGRLDAAKAEELRGTAVEAGLPLGRLLVDRKVLDETELLKRCAEALDLPFREKLGDIHVPPAFVSKVPAGFARVNNLIAVEKENGSFTVAIASPSEIHAIDDLAAMLGSPVDLLLAPRDEIADLITRSYRNEGEEMVGEVLDDLEEEDIGDLERQIEMSEDILDVANKAPVIKLVNMIFFQAIKMRASDIHVQPYQDRILVRYRIDGVLYDHLTLPKRMLEAIVSRVKVMAQLDIAERRLPQDGGISLKAANRDIDLRVSTLPTQFGERVVLRIQDKSSGVYALEHIGLSPSNIERFKSLLTYSHGIILVTGPTGSGKTTTLYAGLARINTADKNIITIEDPIEYQLPGISQIEVATKKGLTFATGLRSIVRQDPDVIMVGEVRDLETAEIAIQSALTGHLVFSTLHTNDAPGALTRLVDLGIEPFLVSSAVIAVAAQRLVRKICVHCRERFLPEEEALNEIGLSRTDLPPGGLGRGKGCPECLESGYLGRTAIHELLPIDDAIREQVMRNAGGTEIKREAVRHGKMETLRQDGAAKVLAGLTSIEEVLTRTQRDAF